MPDVFVYIFVDEKESMTVSEQGTEIEDRRGKIQIRIIFFA